MTACTVNWDLATECGEECASVCPTGAINLFGQPMTVEQVLDELEQDSAFYRESGGGLCSPEENVSCNLISPPRSSKERTSVELVRPLKRRQRPLALIIAADKPLKSMKITITHPNSLFLKYDELDMKLREMLVASGIEPRKPMEALALPEMTEAAEA